jgi:hypothetical protein
MDIEVTAVTATEEGMDVTIGVFMVPVVIIGTGVFMYTIMGIAVDISIAGIVPAV